MCIFALRILKPKTMLKRFLLLFALTAQMTTMSAAKTVIDRIDPTLPQ